MQDWVGCWSAEVPTLEDWGCSTATDASIIDVKIDIDKLTEAELIDLNNRIVERLRFLSQMRAHAKMLQFRIGDRVAFQAEGDRSVIGILTRYNRKTVTVVADDGRRWNVSPTLLRGADGSRASEDQAPNITPLRRK